MANYENTIDKFVRDGVVNRALLEIGHYVYCETVNDEEAYLKNNKYYWFEKLTPEESEETNYCLRLTGITPEKK